MCAPLKLGLCLFLNDPSVFEYMRVQACHLFLVVVSFVRLPIIILKKETAALKRCLCFCSNAFHNISFKPFLKHFQSYCKPFYTGTAWNCTWEFWRTLLLIELMVPLIFLQNLQSSTTQSTDVIKKLSHSCPHCLFFMSICLVIASNIAKLGLFIFNTYLMMQMILSPPVPTG